MFYSIGSKINCPNAFEKSLAFPPFQGLKSSLFFKSDTLFLNRFIEIISTVNLFTKKLPDSSFLCYICTAMRVFYDLQDLPDFQNAVITIGSFDGVHRGHQKILEQANHLAKEVDGESIVITFHPHPRLVVYPKDDSLRLISTTDEKVLLLERYGIDNLVVVPFTVEFSQQQADEYIEKFLIEKFNPRYVVVGYDHRFGLNRQGDFNYLKWYSKKADFEVIEIGKQEIEDMTISSTKIRRALTAGNVERAARLLNHYFILSGTVVDGQKIGNSIGFPTANIEISDKHKLIPPDGIYAVHILHNQQRYQGMLYIGSRPTVKEYDNRTIEVNIFDFDKNIYGDKIRLELVKFIRGDVEFESLEQLSSQLARDKTAALKRLENPLTFDQAETRKKVQASVAIVILNFNGKPYLERFLPFVLKSSYDNYTVYVADNGSNDDSIPFLQNQYPDVQLIDLKDNHGFAKGYNLALQQVTADYYVLLNSDVEITADWMNPIVELMERDRTVAACQPKILDYNRRDYFEYAGAAGGWIDFLGYPFCRGRIFGVTEKDSGQYNDTQEIFWATGAVLFIRAKLFHAFEGFDDDFFAHSEEIDLCWRLKRAGYKIMVRPRSVVYHVGGGTLNYTTPRKTYLNFRNSLFTLTKNENGRKLLWLIPVRLVLDGLAVILFLFQGKFAHIQSILKAHFTFYQHLRASWAKRKTTKDLIAKNSISTEPNRTGIYPGSIVWQYYALRKRFFKNL